jgi:hypothetical protein
MSRVALLLLVVAAAACSGDDGRLTKAEYAERVRTVYAEVQEAFVRTDVAADELAGRVQDAQLELRDAADELEDTEPPDDVEAEHAQLVEGLRAYADDLDRLRNAAERGDERTIEDFNARISQNDSVVLIAEAAESMKFKGYDLGQIAEE